MVSEKVLLAKQHQHYHGFSKKKKTPMASIAIPGLEIKRASLLSDLAYYEPKVFKDGLAKNSLSFADDSFAFIDNNEQSTQLYLFVSDMVCYVAFRGSQEAMDFLTDADVKFADFAVGKGSKVHCGFQDQFKSVIEQMKDFLENHAGNYETVLFTGHSLGAALATLAAAWYVDTQKNSEKKKTVKMINFGSPRVGNSKFCKFYAGALEPQNHWRVFHDHDVVSKLMTRSVFFSSYQHVGGNCLRLLSRDDLSGGFRYRVEQGDTASYNP